MTRRNALLRLVPCLAAFALAACGGEDHPAGAPSSPAAAPGTASSAAGAPAAPAPPAVPPGGPPAAPAPSPKGGGALPAFATPADCGKCHTEIYAEWLASMHGKAMTDPLFLRLSDGLKQEECIRCHAPVPLREMDDWETPIARTERREDAVSCLTCHQAGDHVAGPLGLSGACRPVQDPDQRDVTKVCFACHNQHKTGEEWLAGPYAPDAPAPRRADPKTCLDCHMPWVERSLVPGGPVRRGRRHTWLGGHDMDQLRKAARIEVETSTVEGGTRVRTWLTNAGAGHNIPTDARHRSFDVYVKVWDEAGRVVLDPLDPDPTRQARAQTAKYRLQYRNSSLVDTQVPPLARVSGLGTYKGYVDVPVAKGRGEAWLVYRLTPEDALVTESLTDSGTLVHYRARVVQKIEFTFGG
jgi:hypothetical protein